eukprot:TRINITY_DN24483_c1_g2_i1.p3 TRINITY_DN24483_c1_g2~~TRINITY_DN24483_c1_g2_i1.p3  ORF type:complete len:255 (+),score=34.22 TRINITY_DN24483_c1_g2_i1:1052-1816(+)
MMFYLTLPSNSSMEYYPDNQPSHFLTKLPQAIELNADYEVGLSEILVSNTYFNLGMDEGWFQLRTDEDSDQKYLKIPGGLYESAEDMLKEMRRVIKEVVPKKKQEYIELEFVRASRTVMFKLTKTGSAIKVSKKLAEIFALKKDFLVGRGTVAYSTHPVQLHKGREGIFVYCDLVQPRPVGDALVPLLRIVPTGNRNKDVIHHIFEKPNYIPLSRFNFNTVEILLTNDTGKPLSFGQGKTIATLHFRRRRPDDY